MPITYKCPGCGAAMEFDSETQKLKCSQCGNVMDVSQYEGYGKGDESKKETEKETKENRGNVNLKIYHCSSCGAELVSDEFTTATICSFCGNPSLVEDRLDGAFEPKSVIPFKIDRNQAVNTYKGWLKKGPLTPKELVSKATIEKISGVYVPFWLYDYNAESQMTASAERVHVERHGDIEKTITEHFRVFRDVEADYEKIPCDASEKMEDDSMDKLEPFDYSELVEFKMPYLAGYLSERYNYTDEELKSRVQKRVGRYITQTTEETIVGYTSHLIRNNELRLTKQSGEYALMPVWMLNCRYNGKDFNFLLNGQTGKIVANRPFSVTRMVAWGSGIFVGTLILTIIGGLFI